MPHHITDHLSAITETRDGGYEILPVSQAVFTTYLHRYGFQISNLKTKKELVEALRFCNASDFEASIRAPAPTPGLRFMWESFRSRNKKAP